MTEAQKAAHAAAQDFLDSTGKLFQGDTQLMVDTLRRARGVIMQCAIALAPPKEEARGEVVPLNFENLKAERHIIFEGETPSGEMSAAIFTAQKMGCTNFEIVLKRQTAKGKKREYDDEVYYNPIAAMMRQRGVEVHDVIIYAVTIK